MSKRAQKHETASPSRAPGPRRPLAEGVPQSEILRREIVPAPEIVMISGPKTPAAEQFRRLRTRLINQYEDPNVLVVTSSIPGEGKSTTAINLAIAFAGAAMEKTLLVDADMRRPRVQSMLSPKPAHGLAEVLTGDLGLEHAIQRLQNSSLHVLTAGSSPADPMELLVSKNCKNLFEKLRGMYERVIVDTPPAVPFTDADAVGALADGFVLVVRERVTPLSVLKQVKQCLTSGPILGTVMNAVVAMPWDRASHYEGYYTEYYEQARSE